MLVRTIAENLFCSRPVLPNYRKFIHKVRRPHAAVIVNFHQFHEECGDFLAKGPSVHTNVEDFEHILLLLKRRFRVITLDGLVEHLVSGQPLDEDSVAITIDDGYANNFTLGLPVLEKLKIPATLFIATGYIGTRLPLPMDKLDFLLRNTSHATLDWKPLGANSVLLDSDSARREVNGELGKILKGMPEPEMWGAFDELARILEVDLERSSADMLNWSQVRKIADAGIAIGSHGVSHVCMTRMPKEKARQELIDSKKCIEDKLGRPVRHFAFPNGMAEDFNDELRAEVTRAGYRSTASVERGLNIPGITDALNLKRIGLVGSPKQTLLYMERLLRRAVRSSKYG